MPPPAQTVSDGFSSLKFGADSSEPPDSLEPGHYAFGVNCICRGGFLRPRPGYRNTLIDLDDATSGLLQGAGVYDTEQGWQNIIVQISGELYQIDVRSNVPVVLKITPAVGPNDPGVQQAWMYQAERHLIIQNGQDRTWFFDGASTRRAGPSEIPTGRMGCYAMGRVWQSLKDGRSFIGADLVYSSGSRDDVLGIKTNDFLNESKFFAVPAVSGELTAFIAPAVLDTSLGQGPVLVFTEQSVFSINAPFDDTVWKNLKQPIQTLSMLEYGAQAQDSTIRVNGDVYYRALDGTRAHILARRLFSEPGNTPQSAEMDRVLDYDDQNLLRYGSSILFNNRLLMTCSPAKDSGSANVYHRGIVSLDFNPSSAVKRKRPPVYDGVWTETSGEQGAPRHRVLKLLTLKTGRRHRAFAFMLNEASGIELWEITKNDWFDNQGTEDRRIVSYHESRAFDFRDARYWKKLQAGYMAVRHLRGQCDFNLKFRPDDLPYFVDWETWAECAKFKDCVPVNGCLTNTSFMEQYRPRRKLHQPPDSCEATTGLPHRLGKRFQVRLQVVGYCEIRGLELISTVMPEPPVESCPASEECKALPGCGVGDFIVTD
jgi:hypothetical protein